jgi:peroxin-11B
MRLGRFVDYIKSVLESFHIRNKRIGTLFGLIAVCQGLFMLFDNLLLLNRFKIIHLTNPERLQQYLNQVWLLWLSLALTRDYYEIQASFAIGQHHHYQQNQERSLIRRANVFWANKPLVIDTVKNLCDLYIPLSNLNIVRANTGLQGLAGTISSVLGLLQLWDKNYQLSS